MSGSGYAVGLAIACYEWIAAAVLILVAKYFLPVFIEKKIYTMPEFLTQRYDKRVSTGLDVFWILVYIFVNITAVIYLGALAIERIIGVPLIYGIVGFAFFSALYSLWGGMFLDMTIHDFDMARYITGSEVTEVYAKTAVLVDPEIGKTGDIDTAVITLSFKKSYLENRPVKLSEIV